MPILTNDNPIHNRILHKPCKKVREKDFNSTEIKILLDEMAKIASHPGAAGVAAPQLGGNWRIFAISTDKTLPPHFFFNPILKGYSEEMKEVTEGCLSVIGKVFKLERWVEVKLTWQDQHGKNKNEYGVKFEYTFTGFEAQAVQHEMDHLDGILCCDRADEAFNASEFEESFKQAVAREAAEQIALKDVVFETLDGMQETAPRPNE